MTYTNQTTSFFIGHHGVYFAGDQSQEMVAKEPGLSAVGWDMVIDESADMVGFDQLPVFPQEFSKLGVAVAVYDIFEVGHLLDKVLEIREGVLDLFEFISKAAMEFLPIDVFMLLHVKPKLFLEGLLGIELWGFLLKFWEFNLNLFWELFVLRVPSYFTQEDADLANGDKFIGTGIQFW